MASTPEPVTGRAVDARVGVAGAAVFAGCTWLAAGDAARRETRVFTWLNQHAPTLTSAAAFPQKLGTGPALPVLGALSLLTGAGQAGRGR